MLRVASRARIQTQEFWFQSLTLRHLHWAEALGSAVITQCICVEWMKTWSLACAGGKPPAEALSCYSHSFASSHHYSYITTVVSGARSCVVQQEKGKTAVRCLHPLLAFLPCRLGEEQVGTILLSATPWLSEPASKVEQGEAESKAWGSASLRITGFWDLGLPRLNQPDVPLAYQNSTGFTEIKSI